MEEIFSYFNFFDVFLVEIAEEANQYILCKSDTSYLSEPNFREMGKIIDRMVKIFGPDSDGQWSFDFAKETKLDIEKIHRTWLFETITIYLGPESLNEKFSLVITVNNSNA